MKTWYDQKSGERLFSVGDRVTVPGEPKRATFCGPYTIDKKISDVYYIVCTPVGNKNKRSGHVNMLKGYHVGDDDTTLH